MLHSAAIFTYIWEMLMILMSRSILDGYLNPLVFWYQWEYLLTSKVCTVSKIGNDVGKYSSTMEHLDHLGQVFVHKCQRRC